MINHRKLLVAAATLTAVMGATPALAQDRGESPYSRCAEIADDTARLACFDETYAREGEILAARAEAERQETVENFGLSELDIQRRAEEESGAASAASQLSEDGQITATVVEIFADRQLGKRLFVLDNGQIWRETQVSRMRRHPREGATVVISKESLGRFFLRVEGRNGYVDVRRER